jgi:hypothetical protein
MQVTIYHSEPRPPQAGKTVQWTVLSGERRELGRAAAAPSCNRLSLWK